MSLRLSPFAELLSRAAHFGIIDAWKIEDACITMNRGSRTFRVQVDELIDVLSELTEEHTAKTVYGGHTHSHRPAA